MIHTAIDVDQTRQLSEYDNKLALAVLDAKACPPGWKQYCRSATALDTTDTTTSGTSSTESPTKESTDPSEHVSITESEPVIEGIVRDEDEMLEYPERLPTTLDRDEAVAQIERV